MQTLDFPPRLSYLARAQKQTHPLAKKLLEIMENKKSNLAVAADLTRAQDLLDLADTIGPEICILKTHIDILEDFSLETTHRLRQIADRHHFMIFEDRKFADIGNTVLEQYRGGIYHIADWADIINAHTVPGPGIIAGLKEAGLPKGKALLILAEMSSAGTMAQGHYTEQAVEMAQGHRDFVIGFIAMRRLCQDPSFIYMTPGVQLSSKGDHLGQQYQTPEAVINKGSDIIIVGRGIYGAENPKLAAAKYKQAGWEAYLHALTP